MASLLTSPDDEQAQAQQSAPLTPQQTTTSAGGGSSTGSNVGGSPGTASTPSTTIGTPVDQQPNSAANVQAIQNANSNDSSFGGLISLLQGQENTAQSGISSAQNNFINSVGNAPAFGSTDQATLDQVLSGGQPLSAGQSALSKAYTGPTSFDNSSYLPSISTFNNNVGQLGSADSLTGLLSSLEPGLSPGDARFDATAWANNPNFQGATQNLKNEQTSLASQDAAAQSAAKNAVTGAQSGFTNYDQAGTGYVQSQLAALNSLLGNQLTSAQGAGSKAQSDFNAAKAGTLDPNSLAASEFSGAGSFPGVYNVQPQGLSSLPSGTASNSALDTLMQQIQAAEGQVNPSNYLSFTPGGTPTLGSVATPAQITQYNNANALLGNQTTLQPGTTNPGSIGFNSSGFSNDTAARQSALQGLVGQYNQSLDSYLASLQKPAAPAQSQFQNELGQAPPESLPLTQFQIDNTPPGVDPFIYWADGIPQGGAHKGGFVGQTLGKSAPTNLTKGIQKMPHYAKGGMVDVGSYENGGQLPSQAQPHPVDDLEARVNPDEFVVRDSSAKAMGSRDLNAVNNADKMNPRARQLMHSAISRALMSR